MSRLRQLIDRAAFSGTKAVPGAPPGGSRWLGPLHAPLERFLAGGRSADPLYLTNQTTGQKVRRGVLISLPFALAIGVVVFSQFRPRATQPVADLTQAEVAARTLPDFSQTVKVHTNTDVELVEAVVRRNPGPVVSGTIRNLTDREIRSVEMVFDLADSDGSQVGGAATTLSRLKPHSDTKFQFAIKQANAAFALLRDVTSH